MLPMSLWETGSEDMKRVESVESVDTKKNLDKLNNRQK